MIEYLTKIEESSLVLALRSSYKDPPQDSTKQLMKLEL